jgi:hypothetical protein
MRDAVTEINIENPVAKEAFIRWWRTMEAQGYQYGFEALCNVWVGFDDGRVDLARKVMATIEACAKMASRRFLVRFVDHVGGTNCATWECKKCQGQWVSPANQECPHCHANETIPALTDEDAAHNTALENASAALRELFAREGINVE